MTLVAILANDASAQRTYDTLPNMMDHHRQLVSKFRSEPVQKGRVIFLGNSITEVGNWRQLLGDTTILNRGIAGDVTFGILQRLDEITRHQPRRLFLLIGVNDLYKQVPDEVIIENIFTIVHRVKAASPKTEIFVTSILPLNPGFKNFPAGYDKGEHAVAINTQLQKYGERLGYRFLNIHPSFTDEQGRLIEKFSVDGLHLNPAGYEHWAAWLRKEKLF